MKCLMKSAVHLLTGLAGLALLTLTACTGDGVDGTGYIEGTAATGAPISNVEVSLRDQTGHRLDSVTDADGDFRFDVADLTAPFLMKTTDGNGTTYYTLATSDGVVNINPLTDVVARNWYLSRGLAIDAEFASNTPMSNAAAAAEVSAIIEVVINLFNFAYDAFEINDNFNFQHNAFAADQTGFDRLLDFTAVAISNNELTITLTHPDDTAVSVSIVLQYDLTLPLNNVDNMKPSTPQSLSVLPANNGAHMVLLWNPSSDEGGVGVTGYRIYRSNTVDGDYQIIDETAYAYYIDTQPVQGDTNCYKVEAIDAAGNPSLLSEPGCQATDQPTGPPGVPTSSGSHQTAFVSQSFTLTNPHTEYNDNTDYTLAWVLKTRPEASELDIPSSLPGYEAQEIEVVFDQPGDYLFELHVTDKTSSESWLIHSEGFDVQALPVAEATGPLTGYTSQWIQLEAVEVSTIPPPRYRWTLTSPQSNAGVELYGLEAPLLEFSATTPGDYTFSLVIEVPTDNGDTVTSEPDTITVTVEAPPAS